MKRLVELLGKRAFGVIPGEFESEEQAIEKAKEAFEDDNVKLIVNIMIE